jgi:ribosomal protein L22
MTEEKQQPKIQEKKENPQKKTEEKKEKIEAKPLPVDKEKAKEIEQSKSASNSEKPTTSETKKEISKDNKKPSSNKKEKKSKKDEKPKVKKYEAVAYGRTLPISTKTGKYICKFIKGKEIDKAIEELNKVILLKKVVPYKGEIPHRKGKGIMSGRYPIKASKYFINVLKALKGNAVVNGLELEKTRIHIASANKATRPMKTRRREAKRTHIILKAKEFGGEK